MNWNAECTLTYRGTRIIGRGKETKKKLAIAHACKGTVSQRPGTMPSNLAVGVWTL